EPRWPGSRASWTRRRSSTSWIGWTDAVGPGLQRRWRLWLAWLAVSALGCAPTTPPSPDGGASQARLGLGSGGYGLFEPIEEGDTLLLARGCQGSQHLWIALRIYQLDPNRDLVEMSLRRVDDGRSVTPDPFNLRVRFMDVNGVSQISGLQLPIPDPSLALDTDLDLRIRVTDEAGASAEDSRRIRAAWGDENCGDPALDAGTDA